MGSGLSLASTRRSQMLFGRLKAILCFNGKTVLKGLLIRRWVNVWLKHIYFKIICTAYSISYNQSEKDRNGSEMLIEFFSLMFIDGTPYFRKVKVLYKCLPTDVKQKEYQNLLTCIFILM